MYSCVWKETKTKKQCCLKNINTYDDEISISLNGCSPSKILLALECDQIGSIIHLFSWRLLTCIKNRCTCQLHEALTWYNENEWTPKICDMWLNMGVGSNVCLATKHFMWTRKRFSLEVYRWISWLRVDSGIFAMYFYTHLQVSDFRISRVKVLPHEGFNLGIVST